MGELWMDVRVGVRRLVHARSFALAAVGMLALGIGANTAVFSALKAVLLSPPPYPEPDRLAWLAYEIGESAATADLLPWSWPKFKLLEEAPAGTVQAAAYGPRWFTLSGEGDPVRLYGEVVTGAYFDVLGRSPVLGRAFEDSETRAEESPLVAILGHSLWQESFGGDRTVIGRTIMLNDQSVQVVGVAAPGFDGLSGGARLWVPVPTGAKLISRVLHAPHAHWLFGFGRLAPEIAPEQVRTRLAGIAATLAEAYPMEQAGPHVAVNAVSLRDARSNGTSRTSVLVLMGAAAMVLLIACANLAGLLIARGRMRLREAAVQLALGAHRGRVVRQALVEPALLAALGCVAGLLVARWSLVGLRAMWPDRFRRPGDIPLQSVDLDLLQLDGTAIAFALGAALLTTLLFGLVPALRQARVPVQATLRDGAGATRRRIGRRGAPAASTVLVSTQTALALVLLVGAGLMLGTLLRLQNVDPGFDPEQMLVLDIGIPRSSPAWQQPVPLHEAVIERVAGLSGVEAVTLGCAPLGGHCWRAGVTSLDGRQVDLDGVSIGVHMTPDGFFDALRIPVRAGRTFDRTDQQTSRPVMVLNESAARALFGEANAIGRTVALTVDLTTEGREAEVIGIVGDAVQSSLLTEGALPEAYFSERQMSEAGGALLVRTRGEPLDAVTMIRDAIRSVDATIVVDRARTMNDLRRTAQGETRIVLALLGLFAMTALVLAGAGIWAVVALALAERRRELGLRMALGARADQLVAAVVRQSMTATLVGALIGGWAAWGLARLLSTLLFETEAHDPRIFAGAAVLLLAAAAAASLLPARHVVSVDPARTLRSE